ncbi:unnamed protein product (macronuclear) [Paramecium tetraurelia]|uniref:PARP catalytic domain-containing protein n=1 Tax=Paramecium tetraurelia TaxID=5888 RepID=A0DU56_PARTE|nr:uncharacterized protein GSPATT00020244001 [Paramecium tetraurelia]CAK86573.1 unnamed protein product [Paramecium tetraurelia]|eukprot:XP_001453970.1 hypothetical protein (macronuclear) [Paramecium tetraurelia strain d4-2]
MSEDEEWLNVGKSFVQNQLKQQENIVENNIIENQKEKKKKDKKKEKLSQAQQQIAIKFTEEEIEAYYDSKLENCNQVFSY